MRRRTGERRRERRSRRDEGKDKVAAVEQTFCGRQNRGMQGVEGCDMDTRHFSTRFLRYKVPGTGHQEPAINPHAQRDAAHVMCIIVPSFLIVAHI